MATIADILRGQGAFATVAVPPAIGELLESLTDLSTTPATARVERTLAIFGFPALSVAVGVTVRHEIEVPGPSGSAFRVTLRADPSAAAQPIRLTDKPVVPFLVPAQRVTEGTEGTPAFREHLQADPTRSDIRLLAGNLGIRVEGVPGSVARLELVPAPGPDGVVELALDPPFVLLGETGFGLDLRNGVVIDDSPTAAPPPAIDSNGQPIASVTDDPAWRGIALRGGRLFLPGAVPIFGGAAIAFDLALSRPSGAFGRAAVELDSHEGVGPIDAVVEWNDPTATGLFDLVPTRAELSYEWQPGGTTLTPPAGPPIALPADGALRLSASFARRPGSDPAEGSFEVSAAAADGGSLLELDAAPADVPARVAVTAGALAPALLADSSDSTVGPDGLVTQDLLGVVAAAFTISGFTRSGKLVVHRVGVESTGTTADPAQHVRLSVDYSAAVAVADVSVPGLGIRMDPNAPLRVRFERVLVELTPTATGAQMVSVSFSQARQEVEDPGTWIVDGPALLRVVGTRAGRGSMWFDIDLAFAVDLGPVRVEGATVRVEIGPGGLRGQFRGLTATLDVEKQITARGMLRLFDNGFDAALAAKIVALNFSAAGYLAVVDSLLLCTLDVDLPGPVPLANTGLALFGLDGTVGINAKPKPPPPGDEIEYQLEWKASRETVLEAPGSMLLGLGAEVGTAPDLGFTFKGHMGLLLGTPDFFLRAALSGGLLAGIATAKGVVVITDTAVTVGLRGELTLGEAPLRLFTLFIPFDAHYPYGGDNWYVHIGTDGATQPARPPGPVRAALLPDLFDDAFEGWAFLMVHGDGLPNLGNDKSLSFSGFSVGFGFGFSARFGGLVVWLEVDAYALAGVGTHPMLVKGRGRLSGSLHLGPVSIGAQATIDFQVGPGDIGWAEFEVCGSVDLFFFDLSGCVTISIGDKPEEDVPAPVGKLITKVVLADHLYRLQGEAAEGAGTPPTVWPDAIPIVSFAVGPEPALAGAGPFAARLTSDNAANGRTGTSELRYTWKLTTLELSKVTTAGDVQVAGPLDARWQVPRDGGSAVNLQGARELALLTWESAAWVTRVADGGKDLPLDPIDTLLSSCAAEVAPLPGWALGEDARSLGTSWLLQPDPAAGPPHQSILFATVLPYWDGQPLTDRVAFTLPAPARLLPFSPVRLAQPVETSDRTFEAELRVACVYVTRESDKSGRYIERRQHIRISLASPIRDGVLWITLEREVAESFEVEGERADGTPSSWDPQEDAEAPEPGRIALGYRAPDGEPYAHIDIRGPLTTQIGLLGVRGLTTVAQGSADATNGGRQGQAVVDEELAQQPDPNHLRELLEADTTYALDVGVTAVGERLRPDQSVIKTSTFPEESSRFVFKTARAAAPTAPLGAGYLSSLLYGHSSFDTSQLERYLAAYTPADRTEHWLCDDELLQAHFLVGHVAALARRYKRDVVLVSERADVPPAEAPDDGMLVGSWTALAVAALLPLAQQRLMEGVAAGRCPRPTHGASLGGTRLLEPSADYLLYVACPPEGDTDWRSAPRLPGVRFSTSRYRNAGELFEDLAFTPAGTRAHDGDLEVTAAVPASRNASDGAFEQALADLGLGTWQQPAAGRTTILWTSDGRCRGVLLEAPEPIVRRYGGAARVGVARLAAGTREFRRAASTATGTRLLYVVDDAFPPAGEALELTVVDRPPGGAEMRPVLRCPLPTVPAWAGTS